ncbi:MAG: hypothetical protein GEV06_13230 [Luteitalea sp.]|nr:hypothetical protein [Luteitalea sp.]
MKRTSRSGRRTFLQQMTLAAGAAATPDIATGKTQEPTPQPTVEEPPSVTTMAARDAAALTYPRVFRGRQLEMLAFPLGGVGAGSISLGGRGQLRDWEIFNKPDKGRRPTYAFPAIWAKVGDGPSVARVLEARILPPYEGSSGLGADNVPGLPRLASAAFTGEFPLARIDFEDPELPVSVALEAFTPFIPHEPDESGLPVTVLRYRVTNAGTAPARVSIAFSLQNPVRSESPSGPDDDDGRENAYRQDGDLTGLVMTNPGLAADDPMHGSVALAVRAAGDGALTSWRGWPEGRWWDSPLLYWEGFVEDGQLGEEPAERGTVGALCLQRTIAPGESGEYTFLLAWHFPNRTPARCGWHAPEDQKDRLIGNWYTTKFPDAWVAAQYAASNLDRLEAKTRAFAGAVQESTVPAGVKDAAMANLSTLVANTCFRTADGEFHGFEGVNDEAGCCHGSCAHVWNYETATPHVFPSFARSLRRAMFGPAMDEAGAIRFRHSLPEGAERWGFAAADGQMGQIVHAYLDWRLSGDLGWLREIWPRVKRALEFAWVPGGWDADRDGVMEGVQHNTYDVEFYGPNPQCGIYYLAGLRAGEEMARAVGDEQAATEYRRLFEGGRAWIDENLFNGEYYVQHVRGVATQTIAPALRGESGSEDTERPTYQLGEGCLADQLVGQYLAEVAGLGALLDPARIRKTLESVSRYNSRPTLIAHDSVARTYALNDEAALVVCDYGTARRPRIPFPYYAEVWTGLEYTVAAHMLYVGMTREGVECIANVRSRYDGEKRNPWDEAECGHHYARAMAAWSCLVAAGGFLYDGGNRRVTITRRFPEEAAFRCFWATATGWGTFERSVRSSATGIVLRVLHGTLPCQNFEIDAAGTPTHVAVDGQATAYKASSSDGRARVSLGDLVELAEGSVLEVEIA